MKNILSIINNLKWKQFELQIVPEFVAAQNLNFEAFGADMDEIQWRDYYRFQNFIEQPDQFGNGQYTRLFLGQSFLKYNFKNTTILLSTANQWWGPAKRNALILSNNAGGFPHLSIANKKQIQTKNYVWQNSDAFGWCHPSDVGYKLMFDIIFIHLKELHESINS